MKKHANIILNAVLYLCFCGLAGTGLLLEFRLCEDSHGRILGIAAEDWGDIHEWAAYAFSAILVLHLALHWAWLKNLAAQHAWATALTVTAGVGLVLGLLLASEQAAGHGRHGQGQREARDLDD